MLADLALKNHALVRDIRVFMIDMIKHAGCSIKHQRIIKKYLYGV